MIRNTILTISLIFIVWGISCEWNDHKNNNCGDGEISAADAVWSHGEGDLQNSKRASSIRQKGCFTGPKKNPSVAWTFEIGGSGTCSAPVIAPDGTIYLVAEYPGGAIGTGGVRNTGLFSIAPNGQMNWFLSRPIDIGTAVAMLYQQSVTVGRDGTIYFLWYDGFLYALNPDSTTKWKKNIGGSSPVIDNKGNIYTANDTVYCLNPDGQIKWSYHDEEIAEHFTESIALGKYGIYCVSSDAVYSLDYQGNKRWFAPTDFVSFQYRSLILDEEDNIYFQTGLYGEDFNSLDRNGMQRWKVGTSPFGSVMRSVLKGNYLYFATYGGVYSLDKETGTVFTKLADIPLFGVEPGNTILVDDNGVIYVGGNEIVAVSTSDSLLWATRLTDETNAYSARPALSPDGTLYFVSFYSSAFIPYTRNLIAIK